MRSATFILVPVMVGAALAGACGSKDSAVADDQTGDGGLEAAAATPPVPVPSGVGLGVAGTGAATGLPCDVQAIIENRCIVCHDGATIPPLRNYADLLSPAVKDPTKTRAAVAVELLQAGAMPPKPAAPPAADEIASFADWVKAGAPKSDAACTDPPQAADPTGDAGVVLGDGGTATCTSGKHWTQANEGSPLMHPGAACNACHSVSGGPNLRVAGTVFPSLHDENDCNGVAPPPQLTVVVTDSKGRTFNALVNAAGNFSIEGGGDSEDQGNGGPPPRPPYKARVTDGTKIRVMKGTVSSGDCNSCHTPQGLNGAPGRILAP
jgi:hypothetical protein